MKVKELRERIGRELPCMICNIALPMMEQQGVKDIAYLMRCFAERLWADELISEERRNRTNRTIAELICRGGPSVWENEKAIREMIAEVDECVSGRPEIVEAWEGVREAIAERLGKGRG